MNNRHVRSGIVAWFACVACALAWDATGTNAPAQLGDVVIVNRVSEPVWEVPAAVGVVSATNIQNATAIQSAELLRAVPGVDVQGSDYPGSVAKPVMRGLSPGLQSTRVLVLSDGRRVAEPFQSASEFSLIEADNLDRIEVLRGPASALYGSDAMAGVINLISKRGTPTPFADIRAAGGSDNLQQYRARQGWQSGPLDYFITVGKLDTDGYTKNSDGTDRDWHATQASGNFGLALDEQSEFRFYTGIYSADGRDENSDRSIDKDYEHGVYTWTWDKRREAQLLVRAYRNGDDQVYDWTFPGRGTYDMQTLGGEVQQSLWVASTHRATAGMDFRQDSVDAQDVSGPVDEQTSVTGAYAQDEWWVIESVKLVLGLRADQNADYGTEWSPRVSALWRLTDDAELFGGVNGAHRAPALSDRFFKGAFDNRYFEGNPDLQPESLVAYELGGRARATKALSVELTGFYNALDDSFEFSQDADGVYRNRNISSSSSYGVESGARYDLGGGVDLFANYTWTEGQYDDFPTDPEVEGNQLQYLAQNVAAAGVTSTSRIGMHSLAVRYVDERFADDRNSPEQQLDDYVVVDWRSRVPVGRHTTLTLNIDNLFDEKYAEFYGIAQPGMTVIGGLELAL